MLLKLGKKVPGSVGAEGDVVHHVPAQRAPAQASMPIKQGGR